jgi:nucleotide sugar dehydrogenase
MIKEKIKDLIEKKEARVGVIGLGYVGLPLAVEFARKGLRTIGFEVDENKAAKLNSGASYIGDVSSSVVKELVETKHLSATTDFRNLDKCDCIIICVPTPLRKTKEPDISYIISASGQIKNSLRRGQLIILESTTYPGTTDEVLLPLFEETGLKLDKDFLLGFSPERVDPGNPQYQTHNIPKVIGGCSNDSTEAGAILYSQIVNQVYPVTSSRVAEAAKLLENTFRAVNIGMANEMARLCYALNIDTWEVIRAAATKPFGFMAFYPGPGIGGHCLVGSESVVVRSSDEKQKSVTQLNELFERVKSDSRTRKFPVGGGEVIFKPSLEALSLDTDHSVPRWRPVRYLFRRDYTGPLVSITTSDNRTLTVTDQHPMLVERESGELEQVYAKDIRQGDRLPIHWSPIPIAGGSSDTINPGIDLIPLLPENLVAKIRVRIDGSSFSEFRPILRKWIPSEVLQEFVRHNYLPLKEYKKIEDAGELKIPHTSLRLFTGRGPGASSLPAVINITTNIARFIGYYLSEGCITIEEERERIRLSFNKLETEFIDDVESILENELGLHISKHDSKIDNVTHIRIGSHLLGWLMRAVLKCGRNSAEMQVPDLVLNASFDHKVELLKGLLRGDGDVSVRTGTSTYNKNGRTYTHKNASAQVGYFTCSPRLMQQVTFILQELGFTPCFKGSTPYLRIKGYDQIIRMKDWFGKKGERLNEYLTCSKRRSKSKTFKPIGSIVTSPVKFVTISQPEEPVPVYSVEVDSTHTFATSYGIYVHNCIPLDPHYLSWKARQHGFDSRFIGLAEEVNSRMPEHVLTLVVDGLNDEAKALKGSRVLVLGVSYKKDVDDVRESPALSIIEKLQSKGAVVNYHDPYVAELYLDESHSDESRKIKSVPLTDEELRRSDCVVVVTDHSIVDYKRVTQLSNLIIDTRNALNGELRKHSHARIIRL